MSSRCALVVGSVLELFYYRSVSVPLPFRLNGRHKNVYFSMTYTVYVGHRVCE